MRRAETVGVGKRLLIHVRPMTKCVYIYTIRYICVNIYAWILCIRVYPGPSRTSSQTPVRNHLRPGKKPNTVNTLLLKWSGQNGNSQLKCLSNYSYNVWLCVYIYIYRSVQYLCMYYPIVFITFVESVFLESRTS